MLAAPKFPLERYHGNISCACCASFLYRACICHFHLLLVPWWPSPMMLLLCSPSIRYFDRDISITGIGAIFGLFGLLNLMIRLLYFEFKHPQKH